MVIEVAVKEGLHGTMEEDDEGGKKWVGGLVVRIPIPSIFKISLPLHKLTTLLGALTTFDMQNLFTNPWTLVDLANYGLFIL